MFLLFVRSMRYNSRMAKDVVISGDLAERARRLTGAPTARAAAEKVLREYVRDRTNGEEEENAANGKIGGKTQLDLICESACAVARRGDPFYPGFNYKDLRKNRFQ